MSVFSTLVGALVLASGFIDAPQGLAGKSSNPPQSNSILDELVRRAPLTIGRDDSAKQKLAKQWYNYHLLQLQRFEAIWCLDKRLSYEAARKLLDTEMQLADGPAAVIRVAAKRQRLEAEAPPAVAFNEWLDRNQ